MDDKLTILVKNMNNPLLDKYFKVITLQQLLDKEEDPESIDGILISKYFAFMPEFQHDLLPRMTKLKVVTPLGIGTDSFERLMEEFRKRSVVVALNTGENQMCKAVADFAVGLMLSCARAVDSGAQYLRKAQPKSQEEWLPYQMSLVNYTQPFTGASIGIIGMGRIGFEIAKRAYHAFDMKLFYYGRKRQAVDIEQSVNATYHSSLDSMLPLCDYVIVACTSTPETRNILNTKAFSLMKPNCVIVNVARGDIIDTEALVEALQIGKIAGAGLDVTFPEPLHPGHPLLSMENVIVTPHIAWSLKEVNGELHESQVQNFLDVLAEGKTPKAVLE